MIRYLRLAGSWTGTTLRLVGWVVEETCIWVSLRLSNHTETFRGARTAYREALTRFRDEGPR